MSSGEAADLVIQPYTLDDAMIGAVRADAAARVRVYAWSAAAAQPGPARSRAMERALVLGRGSQPAVELNLDAVRADAVPVFKRAGGGCAVLLDPGNVIVSVALPLPGLGALRGAFAALSDWVMGALASLGVAGVARRGISDLALGDRKIGGACLYRARDLLYYSTTLLVAPDIAAVARYLAHPPREPDYRRGRGHAEFMGCLRDAGYAGDAPALAEGLASLLDAARIRI